MRIVLVGGGTGGHFYPLMAIAEALYARAHADGLPPPELFYLGPDPYDQDALSTLRIAYESCPAGKTRRYRSLLNILDPFFVLYGTLVAIVKLFRIYPDVVMSKGGYTSVPVVLAAAFLRIPIVIHESDAKVGRANKLAARFARYIAITYPEASHQLPKEKVALTGTPIRHALFCPRAEQTPTERPIILVLGGSSGALRVNNLILETLPDALTQYDVIHQTGKAHRAVVEVMAKGLVPDDSLRSHYIPKAFLSEHEMQDALARASVIVSRAGSNTIAEIALSKKPAILIPIPEDVSHDQRANAYAYAREGGAVVLEEKNLTPHLLLAEIERILTHDDVRAQMVKGAELFIFPHAADTLARALIDIGKEHGS